MIAAILASLALWPLYLTLALTLDVLGLVLLLPLSALRAWAPRYSLVYGVGEPKPMPDATWITAWRGGWLTWLWGNEEDGVTGPRWWQIRTDVLVQLGRPGWRQQFDRAWSAYRWSALRNPSNNLRFVPLINPVIRPEAVQSWSWNATTMPRVYSRPALLEAIYTWQGIYSGLRLHIGFRGGLYRLWLGWKLKPEDAQGIPPGDMRAPRCGWATQFKRIG